MLCPIISVIEMIGLHFTPPPVSFSFLFLAFLRFSRPPSNALISHTYTDWLLLRNLLCADILPTIHLAPLTCLKTALR